MSGKSLLDQMLDDAMGEAPASEAAPVRRPVVEPADVLAEVPTGRVNHAEERRLARQIDADRVTARQQAWQAELAAHARKQGDTEPEIAGFKAGMAFEIRGIREDVNGPWVVYQVDPGPAGDFSRMLVARRPHGGEVVLKFTEPKLLDALHSGLIRRLDA